MKSLRLISLAVFFLIGGSLSASGGEIYKFDPARSTIAFKVRQFLGTAKGRFSKFSGTIELDREHPGQSSVVATIQVASIDTGISKRDEHLRSDEFFNVAKFQEITFKSRAVKQTGANAGEITGDLTMHGLTRPITLRVQLLGDPESLTKDPTSRWRVTTAPLKRSQFGLVFSRSAETVSMISDDVSVDIEIEAKR
ncbi:MAG: polyisoprenoid-binding protein [Chthoniobacterales bacterium]|nr:MAG: polyisoprenoid-binding protein [Chthoniobacterales bacterium]